MQARIVSFAGQSVAVRCMTTAMAELADALFADLSAGEPATAKPATAHLRLGACGATAALWRGRELLYRGDSRSALATILCNAAMQHLLEACTDGIALHAAALSLNGRGLLLPGGSGAGKSTLAAFLAAHGFHYLTDELVFIARDQPRIHPFTRPLHLKPASMEVLSPWLRDDLPAMLLQMLHGPEGTMVPHRLLNSRYFPHTPPPAVILFPEFAPGAATDLQPMSAAHAGLRLMACLVNARNLEGHGFRKVAALARGIPAYRLIHDRLDGLDDCLRALPCLAQSAADNP